MLVSFGYNGQYSVLHRITRKDHKVVSNTIDRRQKEALQHVERGSELNGAEHFILLDYEKLVCKWN